MDPYFLELLVTKIFKMHKTDEQPLDEVKLDNKILLPRKAFDKTEIELFCSRFRYKIVKIPDGNRCINNTYENLTPAVKQQIEESKNGGKSKSLIDSSGKVNTPEFAQASQQYKRPAQYK
jgi:hypothetical protein